MKKSTETFFTAIGAILLAIIIGAMTVYGIYASDETMTDDEILSYLEEYPDSERLNELAEKRNLK